ncbi:MAG: hypothetical protein NC181_02215 [Clostridium sp.]|nr:hypothetical protein [Clostridium sp.]MCM1443699.1 hypothetical protein [Candidatus Amulumruptor caecigallinarius]
MNQNYKLSTEQMLQIILQELNMLRRENAELKAMMSTLINPEQINVQSENERMFR